MRVIYIRLLLLSIVIIYGNTVLAQSGIGSGGQTNVSGGGTGSGSWPSLTGVPFIDPTNATYAGGVKANTKFVKDATWSNAATPAAITCTNNDCNFVSADTGKVCYGFINAGVLVPVGTFTFTSAQAGTCSGTTTGAAAANGTFVWGTDDTAAWQAAGTAWLNAPTCGGVIQVPGTNPASGATGLTMITANPVTATTPTACGQMDDSIPGYMVQGFGPKVSVFVLSPNFAYDSTSAGGGRFTGTNSSMVFGNGDTFYKDFAVTGLGYKGFTLSGVSSGIQIVHGGGGDRIAVYSLGAGVTNMVGINMNGQNNWCINCWVDTAAANGSGFVFSGLNEVTVNLFTNMGWTVNSGGEVNDISGIYNTTATTAGSNVITINGTGRVSLVGSFVGATAAGFSGILMNATTATLHMCCGTRISNAGSATNRGLRFNTNNGTVWMSDTSIAGGSTNGAIESIGKTGSVINDLGGNTLTNFVTANWTGSSPGPGASISCASGASPAVCGGAAAGVVAIPTGSTPSLVVNTTAVTASSLILVQVDETLTVPSTTCNTTLSTLPNPVVTARTAGTSFTITLNSTLATNPACVSYRIIN